MKAPREGAWLATDGPYQDYVSSLAGTDPRLRRRDPKAKAQKIPWAEADARVVAMEMNSEAGFGQPREFGDPKELEIYLDDSKDARTSPNPSSHGLPVRGTPPARGRLLLLEGLNPKFVAVIGKHFSLHPSIFVEHERVVVMNRKAVGESDGFPLPSVVRNRDHIQMKYFEPLEVSERPASFRLVCGATGRHIGVSRLDGEFTDVAVVRRKCSVWSKMRANGEGWDCLVISDPPVTRVRTGYDYKDMYSVKTHPYQGGYVDFIPQHLVESHRDGGPPRTSLLNDLVYYLGEHSDLLDFSRPESSIGIFINKIIASHYLKHSEHVRATLSYIQRGLSRKQDLTTLTMGQVEELWSDIQAWERRMGEYCEDVEAIMLQLGIPPAASDPVSGQADWTDSREDYQFLLMRFRELRHRTECLNSAITGLANIAGNRQAFREQQLTLQEAKRSIREAKSTKAVTLLGLLFIPLAYTSSLFSMSEPFRPGDDNFWIYFASSAPLVVAVLAGYYILDWGYTDDGNAWSPKILWASVQVKMGMKARARSFVLEETKPG